MSQSTQGKVTAKAVEKSIRTSIKREISAKGINVTTRRGNKELKFLSQKMANYSFENLDQARIAGEKLGQYLSELFQQKNKQYLDGGLIRQVTSQSNIWSLAGLSIAETLTEEIASSQEDTSQIPVTQTLKEDKSITIKEVAVEESEEPSVPELVTQKLPENDEIEEDFEKITNQDTSEATEESSPNIEEETNSESEELGETDSQANLE
ncbi:MAG: hypothetical protein AB4372_02110 [Xenococcus sp. (in: cyanobacteria)]